MADSSVKVDKLSLPRRPLQKKLNLPVQIMVGARPASSADLLPVAYQLQHSPLEGGKSGRREGMVIKKDEEQRRSNIPPVFYTAARRVALGPDGGGVTVQKWKTAGVTAVCLESDRKPG